MTSTEKKNTITHKILCAWLFCSSFLQWLISHGSLVCCCFFSHCAQLFVLVSFSPSRFFYGWTPRLTRYAMSKEIHDMKTIMDLNKNNCATTTNKYRYFQLPVGMHVCTFTFYKTTHTYLYQAKQTHNENKIKKQWMDNFHMHTISHLHTFSKLYHWCCFVFFFFFFSYLVALSPHFLCILYY